MAISTFAELKTAGANWVERDDLTDRWAEFIALGEARINRELRVNRMLTRATASITDSFSAVPSDFLAPHSARAASDHKLLAFITPTQMATVKEAAETGELQYYALVGTEFEYAPETPNESVALTYYAKVPALSDANTTNWLLTSHPDIYLRAMLLEAAIYLKDGDLAAAQKGLFDEALESVRAADRLSSYAANITPQPGITAI